MPLNPRNEGTGPSEFRLRSAVFNVRGREAFSPSCLSAARSQFNRPGRCSNSNPIAFDRIEIAPSVIEAMVAAPASRLKPRFGRDAAALARATMRRGPL